MFDKKFAFIIQAASIPFFIFINLAVFGVKLHKKYFLGQLGIAMVFIIIALLSSYLTMFLKNGGAPFFYTLIMLFLLFTAIFISAFKYSSYVMIGMGNSLILLIVILFIVASFEQLNSFLMPGAWWLDGKVRPASLTGSKQHYSIILAILSLFVFQYWLSLKKMKYLLAFILGSLGVILSLTRSGAMILGITFFLYAGYMFYTIHLIKINAKFLPVFFGIFIIAIISLFVVDLDFFIQRVFSSLDTGSTGNSERVEAWILGWELLKNSNLILGEYTGVVTNATRTITSSKSFVVESGTLQMILNYGIIGFLCFYAIIFNIYRRINKKNIFLFCILLSGLLSTVVYQSIETIPFITLMSILPIISQDLTLERPTGNKALS